MLLLFAALISIVASSSARDDLGGRPMTEKDLRCFLLKDYDKNARPVCHPSSTINVSVALHPLAVTKVSTVDLAYPVVTLETWSTMVWEDEFLKWDPDNFNGITEIRLSPKEIWKPDIMPYTGLSATVSSARIYKRVTVNYNGSVLWYPTFTVTSECRNRWLDLTCSVRTGSWSYSGSLLSPQPANPAVDLINYDDSYSEWKIYQFDSKRIPKNPYCGKYYPWCTDDFPFLEFTYYLRKSLSDLSSSDYDE